MTATAGLTTRTSPPPHALDRWATLLSLTAVAAIVGWACVDRSGLETVAPAVAAAGIVAGVPHGAMDHLVPGLTSRRWQAPARMALVAGVYVVIAAVASVGTLLAPSFGFATFLVVSAWHFGWAETTYVAERHDRPVPRLREGWWDAVTHGVVVVALPLWSVDGRSAMKPLLPQLVDWVNAIPAQAVTVAVVSMCTVSTLRQLWRRHVLEAVESVALLTLFLTVPVFAAFGVYFGLWHALRHTTRLMDALAPGQPIRLQARSFARSAALPTAAALIVLAILFAYRSDVGVVMTGVSVLLALTFPHVVVVAWLDHDRRVSRASTDG
ncbi:Brp/Blh family beta-carotene 15,15'-dioxygenase [Mycobacterium sp. NPDC006124]|uniref:Brp/Blh family beta-carotene 15,15'-dioxygenase n=1 Tax=Mycobacterium sp. NPDC006124 TaxID=3156729 RepID=UPI0033B9167E